MDARTNEKELLSPEIIFNAVAGEEQAIREVLEFYEKQIYIKFHTTLQLLSMTKKAKHLLLQ